MGLVILALMAALIVVAAANRRQPFRFAAIIGVITFMVTPLYSFGDLPLGAVLRFMAVGGVGLVPLVIFAALAIAVYGGIGALMCWYVRTSIDTRPVRMLIAGIFGAAISGMAYMLVRMAMRQMTVGLKPLFVCLATGAAVGIVVAFAMTHERPESRDFFKSRDGWTVVSALLGALVSVGMLIIADVVIGILMRQVPPEYGMRFIIHHVIAGGILGAGLTVPLRALRPGKLAGALLGGAIGCLIFSAALRATGGIPLAGLMAGAAVGAALPFDDTDADSVVSELPDTSGASDASDMSDSA